MRQHSFRKHLKLPAAPADQQDQHHLILIESPASPDDRSNTEQRGKEEQFTLKAVKMRSFVNGQRTSFSGENVVLPLYNGI